LARLAVGCKSEGDVINIAVEVGGTFTDLVWAEDGGEIRTHKLPSSPQDPSVAVLKGMDEALQGDLSRVSKLFHGSTVATNAVLERKGCRAGLVATRGFRDLLVLQRQLRPNVYAVDCVKPEPLVPLSRTIEASERLDARGTVVTPLDEAGFLAALRSLVEDEKPDALAVCLLHAYANPCHERRVRELVRGFYPNLPVVLSSDVLRTFREYERASTTAMAAYLAPLVGRYIANIERHLSDRKSAASLFIMQSSGGIVPGASAHERPVEMLNSGPAGGVIAATRVADLLGDRNIITLDIGGTSADVCLIVDNRPEVTSESQVDGLPISMPTIDIANVGAGGGSIGWIDRGGMLQVGPQSAGARPGPACYGHGGEAPTLTDALVHLGWIRPERFLGGTMTLHRERADAVVGALASPLSQTSSQTAQALIDIGVAHVSRCIRLVSVQRGHDPKGYSLYGYGGMGPMLGALAAEELGVRRVVVPPHPGLFSALGLLLADLRRVYRETDFVPICDGAAARIDRTFARLHETAIAEFLRYGYPASALRWEHFLEMRYSGQGFELPVPIDPQRMNRDGRRYLLDLFRETHRARYGTAPANDRIEVVTYRLVACVPRGRETLERLAADAATAGSAKPETGDIVYRGERQPCRHFRRSSLARDDRIDGLAVIEEPTATTLVPPHWSARVGKAGALVLEYGA
jgi:N-methylhydantoinase A